MGVTTQAIFGAALEAQPAAPDTYGHRPSGFRLPEATHLGKVRLQVADLERSLAFYQEILGLRIVKRGAGQATLAAHGDERIVVELVERAGARSASGGKRLGLYHYAILLPDRASLGRFAHHVSLTGTPIGAADHLVSEAFYLHDPDGLGIEVYADRPRSAWRRFGQQLMIATDPIDMRGIVGAADGQRWTGMPAGTVIGHVHLHVGDLEQAAAFYSEALGFDRITWNYPGALFLGAGGYHHHLGTNVWAGPSATPPSTDDARLIEWTIELPDAATLAHAVHSISASGHFVSESHTGDILTRDPWGTSVRLRVDDGPQRQH
jgi:catechol 2,3-dioxygenase